MKIAQLRVQNFRQFDDVTIDFPELTTSIVGMNGSGKTTIIDSINILLSRFNPESKISIDDFTDTSKPIKLAAVFDEYYFINIEDGWSKKTLPSKTIVLEINHRSASGNKVFNSPYTSKYTMLPHIYSGEIEVPEEYRSTTPTKVYQYGDNYRFTRTGSGDGNVGPLQLSSVNNATGLPASFFYDGNRDKELKHGFSTLWSKLIEELDWRYFKKYLTVDEESKNDFIEELNATKKKIDTTTTGSRRKDIIQELVGQSKALLGEKYKDLEISYLNPERPHKKSDLALRWPDRVISLDKLGAGERAVVALLLSVIIAKHSKSPIILLVDEMETHLHPQLMTALRVHLEEDDVQIIYTTHSENLIDLGRWRSVKRLSEGRVFPDGAILNQEIDSKKVSAHLDEISSYYYDKTVLKKEDAQILFGNKALIVEGPNDKYCIPVASAKLGMDISSIQTILFANGKTNVPHYQILCNAYGVNYFVIFDKDNVEDGAEVVKNNRITGQTDEYFGFSPSFESVMGKKRMKDIMNQIEEGIIPDQVKECIEKVYSWKEAQ